MKIILDIYGGDNAPLAPLKGAEMAVKELGVDMMSMSGHKIYGPKGVGALYVRRGVRILPLINGGGQEKGLRAGTENIHYILGFAKACQLLQPDMP